MLEEEKQALEKLSIYRLESMRCWVYSGGENDLIPRNRELNSSALIARLTKMPEGVWSDGKIINVDGYK